MENKTQVVDLSYEPTPKQQLMHNSTARQILWGGSAGAGKSRGLRWDAVLWALAVPGIEVYLFRKTYGELFDNHIRPLQREIPLSVSEYNISQALFRFHNGSKIVMAHCEAPGDYLKYMGAEMHVLLIDEAALFLPMHIIELRGRVRLGDFSERVPPEYKKFLPRMVMTSNPGGPAHNFLREHFISPSEPGTIFYDPATINTSIPGDKGWTTTYIPARIADNPYIDPGYGSAFSAMSPERRRALLEGDWDAIEGAALHSLSREKHCIKSFSVPKHWTKFMSMDWGTASPFSIGWFCVVGEAIQVGDKLLPVGAVVMYQELYGWTGKENEGLRLDSVAVAKMIVEKEKEEFDQLCHMTYRVADSAMWAQYDGPSPAERMMISSKGKVILQKCRKDRTANYNEILCRLAGNSYLLEDGRTEAYAPMFYITENCLQAWRTLPPLVLDKLHPDRGPGDYQEDHVYDCAAYALASRPMLTTKQQVEHDEYMEAKQAVVRAQDAYSTR